MNQGLGNVDLDFEMIQKRSFNAEKSILGFSTILISIGNLFLGFEFLMQTLKQILNPDFPIEHTQHFLLKVENYYIKI